MVVCRYLIVATASFSLDPDFNIRAFPSTLLCPIGDEKEPARSRRNTPIVVAAHQGRLLHVYPTQQPDQAGRDTALHVCCRPIVCLPKLFGQHAPVVGECPQRFTETCNRAAMKWTRFGCQFGMISILWNLPWGLFFLSGPLPFMASLACEGRLHRSPYFLFGSQFVSLHLCLGMVVKSRSGQLDFSFD